MNRIPGMRIILSKLPTKNLPQYTENKGFIPQIKENNDMINIELNEQNESFVPDYEIRTKTGTVYQFDRENNLVKSTRESTALRYRGVDVHEAPDRRRCFLIHYPGRTIQTSQIISEREISRDELMQESTHLLTVRTAGGSTYKVDLTHSLVCRTDAPGTVYRFAKPGASSSTDVRYAMETYRRGAENINPGSALMLYLPECHQWLHSSCIVDVQQYSRKTFRESTQSAGYVNYRGSLIPADAFAGLQSRRYPLENEGTER